MGAFKVTLSIFALPLVLWSGAVQAASLEEAAAALGASNTKSIEFSAHGHWFQFGQAPRPGDQWPQFDVSSYRADIDFESGSADVDIVRKQAIDPKRNRPAPVEQHVEQLVNGQSAWSLTDPPAGSPPDAPRVVTGQRPAVEERLAEIWATPQGFVKAALAHGAQSKPARKGIEVSFSIDGKHRYVGHINARNQVDKIKTWVDSPVLGDTEVETSFSDYKDFDGVPFPAQIIRVQGGHPVLALAVSAVRANPTVNSSVPPEVANQAPAPVLSAKLAEGVFYLTGGTHHSVAIEQKDHVVLVEAPLNEQRSLDLIAKIREIIPDKPIRFVIASHVHFDHSGGLRTFVAQGATIVAHKLDKPFFEKAWRNPHTLNPDQLATSPVPAKFQTYDDKTVLSDGNRKIEVHLIKGSGHSDDLALVYLPAEKILVEADAYTPTAANLPPPATPNPYSVNLYDNIQRLNLDVAQIAALHGPRVATLNDLRAAIGKVATAQ